MTTTSQAWPLSRAMSPSCTASSRAAVFVAAMKAQYVLANTFYSPRPLPRSEHQANAQIDAPGNAHAVPMQTPASDPVPRDLRTTCETCRLLHRTCRGGSPTKPCDGCVKRKATCVFKPLGSLVKKRNRKRKHDPTTGEEPEAVPKKVAKNGTVHAPGFDPLSLGLRIRCNYCHLRARSCINGSNTTPCDNCKQRNLICEFGPRKSIVDKETFRTIIDEDQTQEHSLRKTTDEGHTQEHNLRLLTDENYTHEHNLGKISGENHYHEYDNAAFARLFDSKEQNYTQEHGLRQLTNGVYTQEYDDVAIARLFDTMEQNYTREHNSHKTTYENYYHEYNDAAVARPFDVKGQNYTQQHNYYHEYNDAAFARPFDIKEQQQVEVEQDKVGEPKVGMFMAPGNDGQDISFSQEDLRVPDEHLMHPWEVFAARGKLVYDLEGLQCESSKELDEE